MSADQLLQRNPMPAKTPPISDDVTTELRNLREMVEKQRKRQRKLSLRIKSLEFTVDYFLDKPLYDPTDSTGFNEQDHRKHIFTSLVDAIGFDQILETGTFFGNTCGFMADYAKLPIATCEFNERYFTVAQKRLGEFDKITFSLQDSRQFLKDTFKGLSAKNCFIYLDAHWGEDLPLWEEIEIILRQFPGEFVIMIDDFCVPGDSDYKYDDYGPGKALDLATFGELFSRFSLLPFFPSLSGAQETGKKRGCVVLASRGNLEAVKTIDALVPHLTNG